MRSACALPADQQSIRSMLLLYLVCEEVGVPRQLVLKIILNKNEKTYFKTYFFQQSILDSLLYSLLCDVARWQDVFCECECELFDR